MLKREMQEQQGKTRLFRLFRNDIKEIIASLSGVS
jgi:hypothetical protein